MILFEHFLANSNLGGKIIDLGVVTGTGTKTATVNNTFNVDAAKLLLTDINVSFTRAGSAGYNYSLTATITSFKDGILTYELTATPTSGNFYISNNSCRVYLVLE